MGWADRLLARRETKGVAAEAELPKGAAAVMTPLFAGATPTEENAFKLKLVERVLAAVLAEAKGVAA